MTTRTSQLFLLLILSIPSFSNDFHFEPVIAGRIGDEPHTGNAAVAYLNGDTIPDLVQHWGQGLNMTRSININLWLGRGDGTFVLDPQSWRETGGSGYIAPFTGDWNEDGRNDLLIYKVIETSYIYLYIQDEKGEWRVTHQIKRSMNQIPSFFQGDFDGDGHVDILYDYMGFSYPGYKDWYSYILFGDGRGNFEEVEIEPLRREQEIAAVSDFNADRIDDVVVASDPALRFYTSQSIRSSTIPVAIAIPITIHPQKMFVTDLNGDQKKDIALLSDQSIVTLIRTEEGSLTFRSVETIFNRAWNPLNAAIGDMDGDGWSDLIAWRDEDIDIYIGDGQGKFTYKSSVDMPLLRSVRTLALIDADQDNRNDLLVFRAKYPDYSIGQPDFITLLNRPGLSIPTSTPTLIPSEPTPTPSPTPTAIITYPNARDVQPGINLTDWVKNATGDVVLLLNPGVYGEYAIDFPSGNGVALTSQGKNVTLIGKEPMNPPEIKGRILLGGGSVHLQNLRVTYPPLTNPSPMLTVDNGDVTLINCSFSGTSHAPGPYGGVVVSSPATVLLKNLNGQTLYLEKNSIAAAGATMNRSYAPNLRIEGAVDCALVMNNNSLTGSVGYTSHNRDFPTQHTGGPSMEIFSCNRLKIELPGTTLSGGLNTGIGVSVIDSTVDFNGGTILGGNGFDQVNPSDGGTGLVVSNHSTVILDSILIVGGKGGEGLSNGNDGKAIEVDESSHVIWKSGIGAWMDY